MRVARPRKGSWAAPPPRLNHVCDSPWGPPERSGPCSLPSALPAGMPVLPGPRPSLLGAPSSSAPGRPCSSLAGVCTTVRACCVAVIAIRQPARGKERECCGHEPQLQGGRSSRGGGGAARKLGPASQRRVRKNLEPRDGAGQLQRNKCVHVWQDRRRARRTQCRGGRDGSGAAGQEGSQPCRRPRLQAECRASAAVHRRSSSQALAVRGPAARAGRGRGGTS